MRYSISDVARGFGIAVSALRYYDEIGLLRPAGRRGTVREYGPAELRRLVFIRRLHQDGMMDLSDTTTALSPGADAGTARQVIAASARQLDDRITRLRSARQVLEHLLGCPRPDPIQDCPVLRAQADDTIAAALGGV